MKVVATKGKKGLSGTAIVKVVGDVVKISFTSPEDVAGQMFKFDKDECPPNTQNGQFFVQLSGDAETLLSVRPTSGVFTAKFIKMVAREGETPAPQEREGKYGKYMAFMALVGITEGKHAGATYPVFLNYMFADDGDGNVCVKGSGNNAQRLVDFLDVTGVIDVVMAFSDNLLPLLEKKIKKLGLSFQIVVKDGQVDTMVKKTDDDDEDVEDWSEDDEDDTPAPVTKKVKKPAPVVEDDDEDVELDDDADVDDYEETQPLPKKGKRTNKKISLDDMDD